MIVLGSAYSFHVYTLSSDVEFTYQIHKMQTFQNKMNSNTIEFHKLN